MKLTEQQLKLHGKQTSTGQGRTSLLVAEPATDVGGEDSLESVRQSVSGKAAAVQQ